MYESETESIERRTQLYDEATEAKHVKNVSIIIKLWMDKYSTVYIVAYIKSPR